MKYLLPLLLLSITVLSYSQSITVSAVGDLMAHDTIQDYALATKEGYLTLFQNTKKIFLSDDLTFANLETPIDDEIPIQGFPQFNAKSGYVDAIKDAGIEVLSLSNNHSFDQYYEGVKATVENVKKRNLIFSGTGLTKEESLTPVIFNVKGIIIGYFAGTFSLNGLPYYEKKGMPYINFFPMESEKKIREFNDIVRKTKKLVDVMIVSYHSGTEYQHFPNEYQERTLKALADNGADVVLGHHPHVLQKIEYYETKDKRNVLIAYSLGNFISSQSRHLDIIKNKYDWAYDTTLIRTAEGIILQFDIVKWNGTCHVLNPRIMPTFNLNYPVRIGKRYYEGYDTDFMENIFNNDDTSDIRFSKNLKNAKKMITYRYNKIKDLIKLPIVSPPPDILSK